MKKYLYDIFYNIIYTILKDVINLELFKMVSEEFKKVEILEVFNNSILEHTENYVKNIDETISKIQPNIEENLKVFFIEKIRDGKFPKDNREYWACIFCNHIDKKDVKYCSNCGAKW